MSHRPALMKMYRKPPPPVQVKRLFSRCMIVGRVFPVCQVHTEGTIIEVRPPALRSLPALASPSQPCMPCMPWPALHPLPHSLLATRQLPESLMLFTLTQPQLVG